MIEGQEIEYINSKILQTITKGDFYYEAKRRLMQGEVDKLIFPKGDVDQEEIRKINELEEQQPELSLQEQRAEPLDPNQKQPEL